jgi:mannose-6-phosphate isomerase-like protein (cupin superfamily)
MISTIMSKQAQPIDLIHALSLFSDHWSPKRIATLNDYDIKLAKVSNTFVWHSHKDTDELFLVLSGTLTIQFRPDDRENVVLKPNQIFVVPKGVQHCPRTEDGEEVSILLIEPRGVVNTGEVVGSELTNEVKDI